VKAFTFGIVFESAFVVHTGPVRARIMPRENWSANQPEVLPLTARQAAVRYARPRNCGDVDQRIAPLPALRSLRPWCGVSFGRQLFLACVKRLTDPADTRSYPK
jgi:hypothetical protein